MRKIFALLLSVSTLIAVTACDAKVNTQDKEAIEKIVHEYIVNNPEVLVEASRNLQKKQMENSAEDDAKALKENHAAIFNDKASPVFGNPDAKQTVVEFFDYNCGYCRKVLPDIVQLLDKNKDVKVIFKELPILGPTSEAAALASLAAYDIDKRKYFIFHAELMNHNGPKNDGAIREAAAKAGMNADEIFSKAKSDNYKKHLNDNLKLAQKLNVNGTPSFIINGQIIRGAITYDIMNQVLNDKSGK